MTRSRYRFGEAGYPHFMTWTIVGWLPVFTRPEATNSLFDTWRFQQRERNLVLLGYVILENHAHLIATAPELSKATQSAKSYSAKLIIELLEQRSARQLLRGLNATLPVNLHTTGQYGHVGDR